MSAPPLQPPSPSLRAQLFHFAQAFCFFPCRGLETSGARSGAAPKPRPVPRRPLRARGGTGSGGGGGAERSRCPRASPPPSLLGAHPRARPSPRSLRLASSSSCFSSSELFIALRSAAPTPSAAHTWHPPLPSPPLPRAAAAAPGRARRAARPVPALHMPRLPRSPSEHVRGAAAAPSCTEPRHRPAAASPPHGSPRSGQAGAGLTGTPRRVGG